MMAMEKDEYTRFIEKKGRGGCLRNFLVVLIGLILFIVIYDRITVNRYKRIVGQF